MKVKAVKLFYGRTLSFITLIKQLITSYGFITALSLIIKACSFLFFLKVYFFSF
jgi:hypothetical protein